MRRRVNVRLGSSPTLESSPVAQVVGVPLAGGDAHPLLAERPDPFLRRRLVRQEAAVGTSVQSAGVVKCGMPVIRPCSQPAEPSLGT